MSKEAVEIKLGNVVYQVEREFNGEYSGGGVPPVR